LIVEGEKVKTFPPKIFEERKRLAENGICVLKILGKKKNFFVKIKFYGLLIEKNIIKEIEKKAIKLFKTHATKKNIDEWIEMSLTDFIFSRTGKRPLTIVM